MGNTGEEVRNLQIVDVKEMYILYNKLIYKCTQYLYNLFPVQNIQSGNQLAKDYKL